MLGVSRMTFNNCGNARYIQSIDRERRKRRPVARDCPNISVVKDNTSLNNSYTVNDNGGLGLFLPVQSSSYELDLGLDNGTITEYTIDNIFFGRMISGGKLSTGFGACDNFLYTLRINNPGPDIIELAVSDDRNEDKPSWLYAETGPISAAIDPNGGYAMLLVKAESRNKIPHHTIMSFTAYEP